jgi:hypothetical protein
MGQFQAGVWLVMLCIYFFSLFLLINSVVNAGADYGLIIDAGFSDPGFENYGANMSTPDSASAGDTASMSGIKATFSIITGIGAGSINLGVPTAFVWMFSIMFFWIEFIMLIWAIYMAIPFFH